MRETFFNPDGTVSHTTDDGIPDDIDMRAEAETAVLDAATFEDLKAATVAYLALLT